MKKLVNFKMLIKRLWITLCAILIILTIFKLLFNKWYPIVITNETFLKLANYIDNTTILKCIIGMIFYTFSINLWFLTSIKRLRYQTLLQGLLINIITIATFLIKFFVSKTTANIIELLFLIIYPIIYNLKHKPFIKTIINILFPIIIYILLNLFSLNILFIRDIQLILSDQTFSLGLIMQIDYYIFLSITYIGVNTMGWWTGGWFFGKSLTELKEIREEELKKENPDKELLAELEKAIKEKEEE